jgi:hypothetical protein
MPRNKLEDLRNHLFEQLERLTDDELDLDKEVQRADAMCKIGNVLVQSAKAEIDFLRMIGTEGTGTGFFRIEPEKP